MISDLCFINKFLDTDDLNKFARSNNAISRFYLGCYPANVQPKNIANNCCWIWNTDEQGDSGTHWVAVWKQRNKFVFFIVTENYLHFITVNTGSCLQEK